MSKATQWTQDILQWENWIPTAEELSEDQMNVLSTFTTPQQRGAYYLVLIHSPNVLRARTDLYNEALQGESGGPRENRELAAVASSRATGCVYCASVHARAYSGLVHDRSKIQPLLDDGVEASLPEKEKAVVTLSAKLALQPEAVTSQDVEPLRKLGCSDEEILNISYAAAIFANANRLMLTLGEGVTNES